MNLAYNRVVATVVLAVCVVGSVFGMGGGALRKDRAAVLHTFNEGTETESSNRYSMDAYMDNCAASARLMAEEYKARVSATDGATDTILKLCDTVGEGDELSRRYTEYVQLGREVESLYTAFFASGIREEDAAAADFKRAYRNFKSDLTKFERDDYHLQASGYNDELSGFPAGLVGRVVGADELPVMQ